MNKTISHKLSLHTEKLCLVRDIITKGFFDCLTLHVTLHTSDWLWDEILKKTWRVNIVIFDHSATNLQNTYFKKFFFLNFRATWEFLDVSTDCDHPIKKIVLWAFVWKENPNMTHWNATHVFPLLPTLHHKKSQNKADKNGWPQTATEVNSKNHSSLSQWFLVSHAHSAASLSRFARWKALKQRLTTTLFIYHYLLPVRYDLLKSSQTGVKGFYTDMFPIQTKLRVCKIKLIEPKSSLRWSSSLRIQSKPDFLHINIYVSVSFYFSICKPTRSYVGGSL